MPGSFALCLKVIDNPEMATFAAFGSIAMLLLVDFSGPLRDRARSQAALVVAGGVLVCVGTLCSGSTVLAVAVMAVLGVGIIFASVVSAVLATATTALLISFILPLSLAAPTAEIPSRLAGWGIAGGLSVIGVTVLWPAPVVDALARALTTAVSALAGCLRAGLDDEPGRAGAHAALQELSRTFLSTPYRPTGLTTAARAEVRLVDELGWTGRITLGGFTSPEPEVASPVRAVGLAAAIVLDRAAEVLERPQDDPGPLVQAREALRCAIDGLPGRISPARAQRQAASPDALVSGLDPAFRISEAGFMIGEVARNVEVIAAAASRSWVSRLLGRQPAGFQGPWSSIRERAGAHLALGSVSARNALRGGIALGLAVLVARLTGVEHAFWVSLGTLSILRSNALSTGQTFARALVGTIAGFILGAAVVSLVGTDTTLLWTLLPIAVLIAGVAPAAISFTAGQASFTLLLFILFNLIAPAGTQIGFVRVEDIALGGGTSLLVGLLFWPRGAGPALGRALADAYAESARYVTGAVGYAVSCCAPGIPEGSGVRPEARRAAAANRRLDDTFRTYLAERGPKRLGLADVVSLVNGAATLRLGADAILELWHGEADPSRSRVAVARDLSAQARDLERWFTQLGAALTDAGGVPDPAPRDGRFEARLEATIAPDLRSGEGDRTALAVRVLWTGDHLDAVRRLQEVLAAAARARVDSVDVSDPRQPAGGREPPRGAPDGWRAAAGPRASAVPARGPVPGPAAPGPDDRARPAPRR
jgi:hypothetical protein